MGRGKEESGNGKHAISNSPTVFKIPRTVHPISLPAYTLPTKPNIRREKKSKNVPGEGKKEEGKKKKEKNEDPSTVNRAISNFQRSQHTARHLFIFERPRPNQFPFFDSLDRKLPVSLSLPLFFSSSKKKKTRVPATQKYVACTVNSSNSFVSSRNYSKFQFQKF